MIPLHSLRLVTRGILVSDTGCRISTSPYLVRGGVEHLVNGCLDDPNFQKYLDRLERDCDIQVLDQDNRVILVFSIRGANEITYTEGTP